jgi:LPS-assembly protein
MGTVGVNLSWPFIRQTNASTIVLEPIVQLALSPDVKRDPDIPNEDSQIFQFDETDLFSIDKFSGYDLYDGGPQVNVGGRATIDWGGGLNAHVVFGRTIRADNTNVFPGATGLDRTFSDWVVYADTTPVGGLSLFGRALLTDSFDPVRQELGVNFAYPRVRGYVRYVYDDTISTTDVSNATTSTMPGTTINTPTVPIPEHDLEAAGEFFVTSHWGFSLVGIRDLQADEWRQRDIGLIYKDDCIQVEVFYQHQDTIQGQLGHSDTVFVRLTLATLSDQGYTGAGVR